MKLRPIVGVLIPVLAGMAAAFWTQLSLWVDMKEGLIAFLGFLAASLVQVMPITANFLQSDRLTPHEAERLSKSLTNQQKYWMGLLAATILAMILVIVSVAAKDAAKTVLVDASSFQIDIGRVLTFLVVLTISFVLVKMLGLFEGLMSLHRLRAELVMNAAKREAAEKIERSQLPKSEFRAVLPEGYGKIVQPH